MTRGAFPGSVGAVRTPAVALASVTLLAACSDPAPAPADAARSDVVDAATPDVADAPEVPADDGTDPACVAPAIAPGTFVRGPRAAHPMDGALRLNHLQALATHNSYHLRPTVNLIDWAYSHRPLDEQLGMQGVRGVELDLQWNDRCQRLEVYHVGTVDARTTCQRFVECLAVIRDWSARNPGHHPLFIHIEPKFPSSPATNAQRIEAMEREVLSVFDRAWIITPGEVQGSVRSLPEAIESRGWPPLEFTRGRVLFYIDKTDSFRDAYTHGGRDLAGRLMFVDSAVGDPFAGVMVLNNPTGDADAIREALRRNYIVRTRADSSPATAMANDTRQRDAALASGAQIVTTDFPAPVDGMPYAVTIPSGTPSRCSPVTAPMGCTPAMIEDPARLAR